MEKTTPPRSMYLALILSLVTLLAGVYPAQAQSSINLRETVTVDVVRRSRDSIAYITTNKSIYQQRVDAFSGQSQIVRIPTGSLGTGFIIHSDGYIVTNNHVIERARSVEVQLFDGSKYPARVISADIGSDLAILKIEADQSVPLVPLPLGDSSQLLIGEPVIAVGSPLGFSHSVSTGIISAQNRDLKSPDGSVLLSDLIQTDAAINPGNSGGPLLNAYGQVIGINTAIRPDAQNLGFAIQVNKLRDLIPDLMNPVAVNRIDIPIRLREKRVFAPPADVHTEVELVTSEGAMTVSSINGQRPENLIDAYAKLLKVKPGEQIKIIADGLTSTYSAAEVMPPDVVLLARSKLGLVVEEITPAMAAELGIPEEFGLFVTRVERRSPAASAGLLAGDRIAAMAVPAGDGRWLRARFGSQISGENLKLLGICLDRLPKDGPVLVNIRRGNNVGWAQIKLSSTGSNSNNTPSGGG